MMSQIHRVMWGRKEHPATVFVPWDCGYHCPFCSTKAEYESRCPSSKLDYFFDRQKESLRRMLEYGFVDDVVLTGGEPLADVERLDELIDIAASQGGQHRNVYINTSLNFDKAQEERAYRFLVREACCGRVKGISVSLPYADVTMMNARGYGFLERFMRECGGHTGYCWVPL